MLKLGISLGVTGVYQAVRAAPSPAPVLIPIALISPNTGKVFVTSDGRVLTRGTRTVTQEQSND